MTNRIAKEYNNFCIVIGEPKIGRGTWIGYFTVIDGSGGLEIGENCDISSGVHIYTHSSDKRCVTIGRINQDGSINRDTVERKPVKIGNNVFIGANTIILKGVTIGNNVVIGANSLVNKDVPGNSKAYGSPIKVKKQK